MTISQTKCDVCGHIKWEGDHWFKYYYSTADKNFVADNDLSLTSGFKDACGEKCLHAAMGKWLNKQSIGNHTLTPAEGDIIAFNMREKSNNQ